jgi:hypothetical protein
LPAVPCKGAAVQIDVGDLVVVELATGVKVPQTEMMIKVAAAEGMATVRGDGQAIDGTAGAIEAADHAAGVEVPEAEVEVGAAGEDAAAVGEEADHGDPGPLVAL